MHDTCYLNVTNNKIDTQRNSKWWPKSLPELQSIILNLGSLACPLGLKGYYIKSLSPPSGPV